MGVDTELGVVHDQTRCISRGSHWARPEPTRVAVIAGLLATLLLVLAAPTPTYAQACSTSGSGTQLQKAVAALSAGTWCKFSIANPQYVIINGGDYMEYGNKGYWDPTARSAFFCGGSHHNQVYQDCPRYTESTNSWSSISVFGQSAPLIQTTPGVVTHPYDHSAGDPRRGIFYHRPYGSQTVRAYNIEAGTWSSLPTAPILTGTTLQCCASIEYMANIDRLVFFNSFSGSLAFYDVVSNAWSGPISVSLPAGGIHTLSAYGTDNGGYYLFGGGIQTNTIGKLTSTSLSSFSAAAAPAGSWAILNSLVGADPATGRVLQFPINGTIREYNAATNSWRDTGISAMFNSSNRYSCVVIPIGAPHNVMMLVCSTSSQSVADTWLYKHKASGPAPPAPIAPLNVQLR